MKAKIEGESEPVEIISLDEHWFEADEERDYTVTFIRSEKAMRFITKEEYLKLCEAFLNDLSRHEMVVEVDDD